METLTIFFKNQLSTICGFSVEQVSYEKYKKQKYKDEFKNELYAILQQLLQRFMQKVIFTLFIAFSIIILGYAQDCHWVSDHCPVWGGWTDPKCHIDEQVCQGNLCYKYACTYCNAKFFGCAVDLAGGVTGTIIGIEPQSPYNCYGMEIRGERKNQFYVHCGCGGACSFHGNWKINYRKWQSEQ